MRMLRTALLLVTLVTAAPMVEGCSMFNRAKKAAGPPAVPLEPIAVTVKNENFLDMNVSYVVQGSSRRLGMVPGNSTGNFNIPRLSMSVDDYTLTAVPIGGSGRASSGVLSVREGQRIDFRIAPILRQSSAVVRE
jgi:hypothetical protein